MQIVDSSSNVTTFDATVNASSNTATATLMLPTLSSGTPSGTNYTVRAKVCGTLDTEHTSTFNISSGAVVSSVSLSTSQISVNDVTADTKTTTTVKGTKLRRSRNNRPCSL